jgi:hypothetical protein
LNPRDPAFYNAIIKRIPLVFKPLSMVFSELRYLRQP